MKADNKITGRIYGLDILRALAITFVMFSHGSEYSNVEVQVKYYRVLMLDGVGLFFVLSGYLIGGILIKTIKEKGFTAGQLFYFWIRRWFRTLPNYYLVLAILVFCYYFVHQQLPPKIFQYFTFTQNFASPHPLFFGEAWSLTVEEWFYLLVPAGLFILLYLTKGNRRYVLYWILFVLAAGTFIRAYKVSQHDYFVDGSFGLEVGKQFITRIDSIMYGMLGAWISINTPLFWQKYRNTFFILGILLLFGPTLIFYGSLFYLGYFQYSVAALGTLCLLPKLSSITTGKGVVYKIFTFISIISYSMYLTNHMIVQRAIMVKLQELLHFDPTQSMINSTIAVVIFWALTIIISYLLYRFWEKPVMQLRDRWKPSRT